MHGYHIVQVFDLDPENTALSKMSHTMSKISLSLSLRIYYVIIYYNNNFTNHFVNTSKACGFMSVYAVLHPRIRHCLGIPWQGLHHNHLHKSRKPRKGYVREQPQPIRNCLSQCLEHPSNRNTPQALRVWCSDLHSPVRKVCNNQPHNTLQRENNCTMYNQQTVFTNCINSMSYTL